MSDINSLVISSGYGAIHYGIACNGVLTDQRICDSKQASKMLIVDIDALLLDHATNLESIDYYAVHQGPAPFTTLRVCLSTSNALAYATGKASVGIVGIEAFVIQHADQNYDYTIALLNAFCNDVYCAVYVRSTGLVELSCLSIQKFCDMWEQKQKDGFTYYIIGNGVVLHQELLQSRLGYVATGSIPLEVSIQTIAHGAYEAYKAGCSTVTVMPIYLKNSWANISF